MGKYLVIGYGSIGKRHSSILRELGHTVVSVDPSPLAGADYAEARTLTHALTVDACADKVGNEVLAVLREDFDGVLDCTPCNVRAGWAVPARARFVEKPLGKWTGDTWLRDGTPVWPEEPIMMGFCYRWLPSLQQFIEQLADVRIYSFMAISGHDLRQWHEGDYRLRYHGDLQTGGVVRDSLPHSLYFVRRIFGDVEIVGHVSGRLSGLEISSTDTVAVLLHSKWGTPIFILEDYLRSPRETYCEAVTSGGTMRWTLDLDETPAMYIRQMEVFCEVAAGKRQFGYPGLQDGICVQRLLDEVRDGN